MSGTNEELTCQERNKSVVLLPNPGVSESQATGADLKKDWEFLPTRHYHRVHRHAIYLGGVCVYICVCECVCAHAHVCVHACAHVSGTPATDLLLCYPILSETILITKKPHTENTTQSIAQVEIMLPVWAIPGQTIKLLANTDHGMFYHTAFWEG